MKILGLVVEYNPFHNGHILHIQKSIDLIKPDYVIAVMSSSFVQRGEPAIIDKWTRSKQAVQYGIDIVIELPFVYSVQSADYFAKGAIDLLYHAGVTDIVFGSECGDIEIFKEIAIATSNNEQQYNDYVKKYMNEGLRYPDACNQALSKLLNKEVRTPNDLLGLCYVKEIINNDYPIIPHCILRTNDYHSQELSNIASATSIRKALLDNIDVSRSLPFIEDYQKHLNTLEDFYPYLKYKVLTSSQEELKNIHLVDEGLENRMKQQILSCHSMNEFIDSLSSKRYTKVRIQRMIIHLLLNNTKDEIKKAMNIDYLRILACSKNGREYLKILKKTNDYNLVSNYTSYTHPALDIEAKATSLISLINKDINEEYKYYPYIKGND
ncbi:MAG: nucleotidyltransferase [Bacilli bacterium]|nr:nucleotidyltransferase [Bacilli bacterium]